LCDDIAEALAVTWADTDMGIRMHRMGALKRRRLLHDPSDKSVQIGKTVYILYNHPSLVL